MKKYRIVKVAGYYTIHRVQRRWFGFLWLPTLQRDDLHGCREYVKDKLNPVVEEH